MIIPYVVGEEILKNISGLNYYGNRENELISRAHILEEL